MVKILIIDDEAATLDMLQLYLGACGYDVLVADNEASGMDIFTREQPPIVLTDVKMPGKDGFSVLRQIKARRPETQVIVITGHGDKDLAQRAFDLKANDFFNKPLDTEALIAALGRACKQLGGPAPTET